MATNRQGRQFAELLGSISRAVARVQRERVCCGDLTYQQFETLAWIHRSGAAKVRVLSEQLAIDESTASRNVSVLVRDGYLLKERDLSDGRAVRLVLSAKGQAALSTLRCGEEEALSAVYGHLSPDERAPINLALQLVERALSVESSSCCGPEPPRASRRPNEGLASATARHTRTPSR